MPSEVGSVVDQVGSDDHHRSEKDVAFLEKCLPPRQGTYCSALPAVGSRGCYERSPVPSEASRKGQRD